MDCFRALERLMRDHPIENARLSTAIKPISALVAVLAAHEAGQIALKVFLKLAGRLCPRPRREQLARAVYWRCMHNPNFDVRSPDVFFERMCKPRFGWFS